MSEQSLAEPTSSTPATSLQFEHAEVDAPQAVDCSRCNQRIHSVYYEVNSNLLCERCKFERESQPQGGGAGRFARASMAGFGAAVAGSLLYFGVSALTGYEFGLIAIVVGFAVGKAVHWGARGRGGWRYQTLAIALTYLSIVATYVPPIIQAAIEQNQAEEAAAAETAKEKAKTADAETPTLGGLLVAVLMLGGIAIIAPFLAGFQNIIGLLIISFGLYEAWKINRKVDEVVNGPFRLGEHPPIAAA
jgi:hypothetical protein